MPQDTNKDPECHPNSASDAGVAGDASEHTTVFHAPLLYKDLIYGKGTSWSMPLTC